MGVHFIKIYGESSQMRALFWASVDNSYSFPHSMHIFPRVMHISLVVNNSIRMLQYLHIKQNADLIKSFYAFGFFKDASEVQDVSVEKFNLMKLNMGGVVLMIVVI